jgi:5-formyltetrahydrofolate cyclo-ligase
LNTTPPGDAPDLDASHRKTALRANLRAQRAALTPAVRMAAAEAIVTRLAALPTVSSPGYVGGYWATGGELPLHVLQMRLRADQIWCLPCLQPGNTLKFAPWRAGDPLVSNAFGIPEPDVAASSLLDPADLGLVLLPLLGFSRDGQRLGMGGGYYDRSFAFRRERPAPPLLVGIGYAFQEAPELVAEPWDVRLDAVVTDAETIVCRP